MCRNQTQITFAALGACAFLLGCNPMGKFRFDARVGNSPAGVVTPRAIRILQTNCGNCHSTWMKFQVSEDWISSGFITPGSMSRSIINSRIQYGSGVRDMPPSSPTSSSFTQRDYAEIASWVDSLSAGSGTGPTGSGGGTTVLTARIAPSTYIKGLLDDIFGPSAATITSQYIMLSNSKFSRSCDPMGDADNRGPCFSTSEFRDYYAESIPLSSVPREGQRLRTINALVFNPTSLSYAIRKATGNSDLRYLDQTPIPTEIDILGAWRLFHPGQTPPQTVIRALTGVANAAYSSGERSTGPWAWVFLAIGHDPSWQVP